MGNPDAYLQPYHAAELIEPLLSDVDISKWTSVTSDNKLMRCLLSWYFLRVYHEWLPFPKDLFLQDMGSGRTDYCSELLVNAVLAAACLNYHRLPDRGKFWVPESFMYKFIAEAKRLWELESFGPSRLTTIQAALNLATTSNLNGIDKVGFQYVLQAIAMCHELDLFKPSIELRGPNEQRARTWTAWAIWAYQTQHGYYFLQAPEVPDSPEDPLPDPIANPKWHGETWLQYPLSSVRIPVHLGHAMKARMDLLVIMNEVATESFSEPRNLSFKRARYFHSKLQNWYRKLPAPLLPKEIFSPIHFAMHLDYCNTIVALFEPHLDAIEDITNANSKDTPRNIVHRETAKVETLLRLYYLRHNFEGFESIILMYIMIVGNRALQALKTPTGGTTASLQPAREVLRSTLILCATGLRHQANGCYLASLLFLALSGHMDPEDKQLLHTCTNTLPEIERPSLPKHALLNWPIPIIKMNEDPEKANLNNLLKRMEQMTLETRGELTQAAMASGG